jgi:hypothetical protein
MAKTFRRVFSAALLCRVLLAIGLLTAAGLSAEKPPVSAGKSARTAKTTKAPSKPQPERLAWDDALGQVKLLAAKFQEYRDTAVAGKSLASLAAVVCQHDKSLAPVLFHQALDLVKSGLMTSEASADKTQLWAARAMVISSAAQCDPQLANRLNRELENHDDGKADSAEYWSNLLTANNILETNETEAVKFAEAISRHILDLEGPQLQNFYGFLWRLRQQSPSAADQLFLQALNQLQQNPSAALRAVNTLGNYVFAPAGFQEGDGIAVLPFGDQNDYRVYVLQVQRTGATPLAIQAYLATAAQVLSTVATSSEKEAGVAYAGARQLLDRSLEVAPDLALEYEAALQRVSPSFSDGALKAQVLNAITTQFEESRRSLEDELEKCNDPRRRDEIRLTLFNWRWRDREVSRMEVLASAVELETLRAQLMELAAFRKVQLAVERKEAEQSQLLSRSLTSPLHKTLALLGIAQQHQKRKEPELATAALNVAIREAEKTEREERPYLLVSVAAVAGQFDAEMALRNLEDAITGLNHLDGSSAPASKKESSSQGSQPHEPISASSHGFVEYAYAGKTRRHFPLDVAGLSFDLPEAAKALRSSPPEHLSAVLLSLQSEARQGPALAAAAASFLQRAKPRKSESK